MLKRYNNIDYVLNLDIEEGFELIQTAYKKQAEEQLWDQWLVDYSRMDSENFISFADYKNKAMKKENKNENKKEKVDIKRIIEEAEMIKKAAQKEAAEEKIRNMTK